MSNFQTIDQEIIGGLVNGCIWGGPKGCRVLARTPDWLVLWASGGNVKSGGYHYVWHPATLVIVHRRNEGTRTGSSFRVCSGERIHNRVFTKYAERIDKIMGDGFHQLLDVHKTVVVGDNKPFSKNGHELPVSKEWQTVLDSRPRH